MVQIGAVGSAWCFNIHQFGTSMPQGGHPFDHLVGAGEQRRGYI
jgi:hypothetical protein